MDFVADHQLFQEIYEFLFKSSDDTAERIRMLEGKASGSVNVAPLEETNPKILLSVVLQDFDELIRHHRSVCCLPSLDPGTLNFLSNQLEGLEKLAWKVRSELGLGPVSMMSAGDTKAVARALVFNEMGLVLVVKRADEPYVMIPGGHLTDGETPEMAAIRETWEETGFDVKLTAHVIDVNDSKGNRRYFHATLVAGCETRWDGDGGVDVEVRWLPVEQALTELTSDYDKMALRQVLTMR
jgi:8-oxo-dGTP pyrophosphatase MutT (NUDIX family)